MGKVRIQYFEKVYWLKKNTKKKRGGGGGRKKFNL
jgi:hypothetical protein